MITIISIVIAAIAAAIAAERHSQLTKSTSTVDYYKTLIEGERKENEEVRRRLLAKEAEITQLKTRLDEESALGKKWREKCENQEGNTPHLANKLNEEYAKLLAANAGYINEIANLNERVTNFEAMIKQQDEIIAKFEAKEAVRREKKKIAMQRSRDRKKNGGNQ